MTTQSPLTAWIDAPDDGHGIAFAVGVDGWDRRSYAQLAALARRTATGLVAAGVRRGDVVAVVDRGGESFVGAFFGALLAGATVAPLAPPALFADAAEYGELVRGRLATARAALVVAEPGLRKRLDAVAGTRIVALEDLLAAAPLDASPPPRAPAPHALLQFTSGASGRARGIRVPAAALAANVRAIARWLGLPSAGPTASWLPVHHDMGLVGCLLTPVVCGADLRLMTPEQFVRDPLRYLRCFGAGPARLSAMPCFALEHIAERVAPATLEGLDFSAWDALVVGAEPVAARALRRFLDLLGPHGLRREALLPAYGLAEATLAVTGLGRGRGWHTVRVDPAALALGRAVPAGEDEIVGCGQPLRGAHVAIEDPMGRLLPPCCVGEIVVSGAAVATAYARAGSAPDDARSATTFVAGGVRTGDAGFLHDGELFVLGRLGDALKVRGRAVFAEDIERALVVAGLPARRLAVALGEHAGVATAVVVLEVPRDGWSDLAAGVLRRHIDAATLVVVNAPRATIRRTSNGKPRRRELWAAFVEQRLAGAPISADSPGIRA